MRLVQPVNGLDPTTFTSVAVMEREVDRVRARAAPRRRRCRRVGHDGRHGVVPARGEDGPGRLAGCRRHRDAAARRADDRPRRVPEGGALLRSRPRSRAGRRGDRTGVDADRDRPAPGSGCRARRRFGAVVSVRRRSTRWTRWPPRATRPASPATSTPASAAGSCRSGGGRTDRRSLRLGLPRRGVTSISADLHKFGYAPKGASVLLQRDRDRQRLQYFATTTLARLPGGELRRMLGSKSAGALAASWAIVQALGARGLRRARAVVPCARPGRWSTSSATSKGCASSANPSARCWPWRPTTPCPVTRQVDPHHWADQARRRGWLLQLQPGLVQADGTRLPHTTHLTVTPVTEERIDELEAALRGIRREVRGVPAGRRSRPAGSAARGAARAARRHGDATLDSDGALQVLKQIGLVGVEPATARRARGCPNGWRPSWR